MSVYRPSVCRRPRPVTYTAADVYRSSSVQKRPQSDICASGNASDKMTEYEASAFGMSDIFEHEEMYLLPAVGATSQL